MSREAFEAFGRSMSEEEIRDFQQRIGEEIAAGQSEEEACAAWARSKGYDVSADDLSRLRVELTEAQTEEVTAGIMAPSCAPIVDWIWGLICGHDWYFTGREKEESFYIFWSKHKKLYKCRKCGVTEWRHED